MRGLARFGFEVTGLTDGVQAVEVFRRDPYHFDAVVTDLTMPQVTGLEVAVKLLEIRPDHGFITQRAAYVASTQGVNLDVQWQGFTKGLFGQGLFMIKVTGEGVLFANCFGALDRHVLAPGERLVVDNFHLVAFSDSCKYEIRKFGGWKSTILGGEWLVTEIEGPGEVYIQTKNIREFADWLWTVLGPKVAATRSG